jgi:hypothetical protein
VAAVALVLAGVAAVLLISTASSLVGVDPCSWSTP